MKGKKLLKKALGYTKTNTEVEEYTNSQGKKVKTIKISKREVLPDTEACIKLLRELEPDKYKY